MGASRTTADNAVRQALGDMARALAADASPNPPVVTTPVVTTPAKPVHARRPAPARTRLILKISQDAYQGNAQYTVSVDGKQVGGTFTASASHAAKQSDILTLKGDWTAGAHKVEVKFLNDAYGGSAATDRNLYVDAATYNSKDVAGAAQAILGQTRRASSPSPRPPPRRPSQRPAPRSPSRPARVPTPCS